MKKIFRTAALVLAVVMMVTSLCGCSAFIEGFLEGYNSTVDTGDDTAMVFENVGNDDEDDDDDITLSNDDQQFDSVDDEAAAIFASNTGNYDESDLIGEWTDLENETIKFMSNGFCNYFGTRCESYSFDGKFLVITCNGEDHKYPARLYGDTFVIFYEPYYYGRTAGDTGSLYGRWESTDDNEYIFEFYPNGKFTEDDEYSGNYYIKGTDIILLYDDEDYVVYGLFNLHEDGDQLGFAYGWTLERTND